MKKKLFITALSIVFLSWPKIAAAQCSTYGGRAMVVQASGLNIDYQRHGASVSEIADHIGLTMPSASKLVEGLVRRGYLERRSVPLDRRTTLLLATGKGRRAMTAARRTTRRHLASMLDRASIDELRQIAASIAALRPIFLNGKTPLDRAGRRPGRPKRR